MAEDLTIVWRQEGPAIFAAYVTGLRARDIYVGYVATSPDHEIWWRGYMGAGFTPVGKGPRQVVQAVIEQRVREALEQRREEVSSEQHE
jgi:hypothetical protein